MPRGVGRRVGFSDRTVDGRVRHYCPFPHRTRPPEWDEDDHGVVLTGPFSPKGQRPTTRSYECHPGSLAHYRLLPVALTTRGNGLQPLQKRSVLRRPGQSHGRMALEGMTSTAYSPAPSTTWNRSHLRHCDMIWSPRPLRSQNYRARGHHSSSEGKLSYVTWGLPRTSTSWLRADTDSPAGYPCGRGGLLESKESTQGTRLPRKKAGVPVDTYPIRTSPVSTKNKINPEDVCDLLLKLVTSTLCLSVTPMTLCPRLTSGQVQNKAAAPCNLTVNDDEIRVMSMCCYPQCGLGPDTPEGDLSCLVFRCPQYEFLLIAREGNHLRPVGLLVVCAVPFSEVVPFSEKLTGDYHSVAIGDPNPLPGSSH